MEIKLGRMGMPQEKRREAVKHYDVFRLPYVYVSIAPFLWSTNVIVGKILVTGVSAWTMVAVRVFVTAAALAVLLKYFEKEHPRPSKRDCLLLLAMGGTGVFGFNILTYIALRYTTAVNNAMINAFYPALATVFSFMMLKEGFDTNKLIGLVLSLTGILLITFRGSWSTLIALQFNPGDALSFLATACWAVYSVMVKMVSRNLSALAVTGYSTFWGLACIVPFELVQWAGGARALLSWQAIVALLYLGIFAGVAATLLWNRGIQEVRPGKSAYFYNLLPVYAAFLAILFLGEKIYWYHIVGSLAVIGGVLFGSRKAGPDVQLQLDGRSAEW